MSDSDGGIVKGRKWRFRRSLPVLPSSTVPTSTLGYASFETGQGFGVVGIPVECYKWQLGATTWRHTSADRDQVLSDGTFTPETITRDAMDFSQEDSAQNLSVRVSRLHAVAQLFRSYNPVTPVTLTIYRKHRSDPEEIIIFSGKVVSCNFEGPEAILVCAPVSHAFRRHVPSTLYQPLCNWALFGMGCGLDKNSFKLSGFVTAVGATSVRATVFASQADGWLNNGWAELASGERRFIVSHVGDAIVLGSAFSSLPLGTAIDAYAGCDLSETVCRVKFNNLVNHLGFPRVPTRNPFDGSIV